MTRKPQIVLITGASSGIGAALAKVFAGRGFDLILTGRQKERLSSLADALANQFGVQTTWLAHDLKSASGVDALFNELESRGLEVDILVNNAGLGFLEEFAQGNLDGQDEVIQVNMTALTRLTRLLLPKMMKRGEGKILNVSSLAAFQPGPLLAVYYASKAYVNSFSEALSHELRASGITVTALCPGGTDTAFQRRSGMSRQNQSRRPSMTAEAVAKIGFDGLMRGRRIVIPGWHNRMLMLMLRIFPRSWVISMVGMLNESLRRP
jgi:uncharacterized protein